MFEKLYEMYCDGDEKIYDILTLEMFEDLINECDKDSTKYDEFQFWLAVTEEFYYQMSKKI